MPKFSIYSHDKSDPESNMVYICTCSSKEGADYVVNALEYRDTGGKFNSAGMYEYYIKNDE